MRTQKLLFACLFAGSAMLFAQTVPISTTTEQTPPDQTTQDPNKPILPPQTNPTRAVDPVAEREKAIKKLDPNSKEPATGTTDPSVKPTDTDEVTVTDSGKPDLTKEYTGPAVLTRSYAVERPPMPENVKLRPTLGVSGVYDTALAGLTTLPDGSLDNRPVKGVIVNYGMEGRHYWKHDIVDLSFSGTLNRYTPNAVYNGNNINLAFNATHQIAKRVKISIVENLQRYTLGYSLSTPLVGADTNLANISLASSPTVQIFDTTTTQNNTDLHLTWQKSARLSFNFTGSYFLVNRTQRGLVNSKGQQAGMDMSYRLTRKSTVGLFYSAAQYRYSAGVGNTFLNSSGIIYSHSFDPRTELRGRFGVSVMQNLGLTTISVDPTIAKLLGQTSALVQSYSVTVLPDISVSLSRILKGDRGVHASYTRSTTPGNGVFLSSTSQEIDVGLNTVLLRRYRMTVGSGRSSLTSVSQVVGQYTSDYVRVGVSRYLTRTLQSNIGYDFRHFEITSTPLLQNQNRVMVGVTWTNDQFPRKVF